MNVRGNVVVNTGTGSGDDTVSVFGGNEALEIKNLSAAAAFLAGGAGSNSLVTDTATRTSSRRLKALGFHAGTTASAPPSDNSVVVVNSVNNG